MCECVCVSVCVCDLLILELYLNQVFTAEVSDSLHYDQFNKVVILDGHQ